MVALFARQLFAESHPNPPIQSHPKPVQPPGESPKKTGTHRCLLTLFEEFRHLHFGGVIHHQQDPFLGSGSEVQWVCKRMEVSWWLRATLW